MALFDKKDKDVKDKEGEGGGEGEKKTPEFATAEQLAEMKGEFKGMLDTAIGSLSEKFDSFGQMQQRQMQMPVHEGPDINKEIEKLDQQLSDLDGALDDAVQKGEGISAVQKKREKIIQQRSDLIHKQDIEELRTFGTYAIDQLSERVVNEQLDLLRIPEVKNAYDQAMSQMTPQQRMNPETRMLAYKFACGENMDKIFDMKLQEHLRTKEEEEAALTQKPTGSGGRGQEPDRSDPNFIPDPKEILSAENLMAIRTAGKDIDSYYKSLGYAGGWEDFWKTDGKEYFMGEEG